MLKRFYKLSFFIICFFLTVSCSQPQESLGRAILSVDQSKSGLTYRFASALGDRALGPESCVQEMNSLSSFSAGSYAPGLWTFAVCGFDSDENAVLFGKATVYLSSGETSSINIEIGTLSPEDGDGSASFTVRTAAVRGTHDVSVILLKDGVETGLSFNCTSGGNRAEASRTESLESGLYTVTAYFYLEGVCYCTDVSVLHVYPDREAEWVCQAEIMPAYIDIDFTDIRLDYGLGENTDKICTGFRSVETGEEIDLDEPYLSPVGVFWSSAGDLGLEPIVATVAETDLSSVHYLAIGSAVRLTTGMFSNTSDLHNTSLTSVVCYASTVPREGFAYCDSLKKICLDDGVNSVGRKAFAENQSLESIYFAPSVTSLNGNCFSSCNKEILHVYVPFAEGGKPTGWITSWTIELKAENITYNYLERST